MLGVYRDVPRQDWGYRNSYIVSLEDSEGLAAMGRLMACGLVERAPAPAWGAQVVTISVFYATGEGKSLFGLM